MIRAIREATRSFGDPGKGLFIPLFGFPVRINHSFWLIAFVVALQRGESPLAVVGGVLVLLVSILLHELGHALVASKWAVIFRINVHAAGGMTAFTSVMPLSWVQRVAISLAGPGTGLLVGLALYLLPSPDQPWLRLLVRDLLWINVAWGLFNLLPVGPLDGGEVLKVVLLERWPKRAELVAAAIGIVTAVVAGIAAIVMNQPGMLLVLGICGFQNFETLRDQYENRSRSRWQKVTGPDQVRDRYR